MISIIICSRSHDISDGLYNNIKTTIGAVHEIIAIDNSNNDFSIFSAYNAGIRKSKYDILCFIHEDVLFHTQGWGTLLVDYFHNLHNLGCIGVAGATYKSKAPSGWWEVNKEDWHTNIIQHFKENKVKLENNGWKEAEKYREVAVIDGVFMATRKSYNLKFDEKIHGFHAYDLNLCFEARKKGLRVVVTKELLLEHFSQGRINKEWVIAMHQLHKRYNDLLPISINGHCFRKKMELTALEWFIYRALDYNLKIIAFNTWLRYVKMKPVAKAHFTVIKRLLQP